MEKPVVQNPNETRHWLHMLGMVYLPIFALMTLVVYFVLRAGTDPIVVPATDTGGAAVPAPIASPVLTNDADTATTTIIVLGDSISAGYGLEYNEAYPVLLESALREAGHRVAVVNAGVSGDTTTGGLARIDFILKQKPSLVIVALGGNDMLRGIDPTVTKQNIDAILARLQAERVAVILAGMRAVGNLGITYQRAFDGIFPELATKYNVPLIPFLLEGIALDPALNQSDGIHPNAKGQQIIAEELMFPVVVRILGTAR